MSRRIESLDEAAPQGVHALVLASVRSPVLRDGPPVRVDSCAGIRRRCSYDDLEGAPMPYKIKDLLIDLDPAIGTAQMCRFPSLHCRVPSLHCRLMASCGHRSPCPDFTKILCRAGSRTALTDELTYVINEGALVQEDLVALQQQLEQALMAVNAKRVEAEAAVVREPQTAAEVEALEAKLEAALVDLRARKARLGKT